ncbi:MAG: hypothetical protein HZR80_02200 [Candidatus Heimdallarchaeota archaeon]
MTEFDKVIECFKIMDFPPDIEEFEDRIIVQKVIFLLKIKDIEFDYDFNLYLRGPYCPELTKDMFDYADKLKKLDSNIKFNNETIHQIKYLKYIITLDTSLLEIAATYAYFTEIEKVDSEKAIIKVKRLKHFISENKITKGIYKTKEYIQN